MLPVYCVTVLWRIGESALRSKGGSDRNWFSFEMPKAVTSQISLDANLERG